jgi:beta-carotene ketolase (CrtW type)
VANEFSPQARKGLVLAGLIGSAWLLSLGLSFALPLDQTPGLLIGSLILLRAFLHTGLFIVAHDSMHSSLVPAHPGLNRWIGKFCLLMYAGLSYERCCRNHRRHHLAPETSQDPDYQRCTNNNILDWYVHFMGNYLGGQQLLNLSCLWLTLVILNGSGLPAQIMHLVVQRSATGHQFLSIVSSGNLVTPPTWGHDTTGRDNAQPALASSTLFRSLLPLWLSLRTS